MTYTEELREFDSVLTLLEPQVRKVFLEKGIPLDFRDYDYARHLYPEKTVPYRFDSKILERASWLAYDLGICDAPLLIEVEENGRLLVDGSPDSIKKRIHSASDGDIYHLVHVIPESGVSCGKLLGIIDSIREFGAQRMCLSNNLSTPIWLEPPHGDPVGGWEDGIKNFSGPVILLEKGDSVRIRNESTSLNLGQLMDRLSVVLKERDQKRVILLVDGEASCGFLIETAKTLRKGDIEVILFFSDRTNHYQFMLR